MAASSFPSFLSFASSSFSVVSSSSSSSSDSSASFVSPSHASSLLDLFDHLWFYGSTAPPSPPLAEPSTLLAELMCSGALRPQPPCELSSSLPPPPPSQELLSRPPPAYPDDDVCSENLSYPDEDAHCEDISRHGGVELEEPYCREDDDQEEDTEELQQQQQQHHQDKHDYLCDHHYELHSTEEFSGSMDSYLPVNQEYEQSGWLYREEYFTEDCTIMNASPLQESRDFDAYAIVPEGPIRECARNFSVSYVEAWAILSSLSTLQIAPPNEQGDMKEHLKLWAQAVAFTALQAC